ncbi:zinc-finger of mitochondrial splicing suppressor 51-domain-containing protein [Pyronema domesticum]|uniref:Similar to Protein MSS51, mitochondrial acc. no. P32335 n=1 Tax=Pyronema omphalodes (strain CBS 100304) TaxID=1076935 RepID=U4LIJ9_PYROM|nr:zinc-finger of mitochondrial splicing suppressor 51-domain-containing protein [Pyronema domesticum]CCX31914.1 Similar to Protein MSS51, mitochondrial; acc. no. P32335 [Pyronema omphalodes CBS 100304]
MASIRASAACRRCLTALRPSLPAVTPRTAGTLFSRSQSVLSNSNTESIPPIHGSKNATTIPREGRMGALEGSNRVLLREDNLFHPMDKSPIASIRERAARIKSVAYCPHGSHTEAGDHSHVKFTCPDCGVPTYCSEEHWADDYENHLLICETLKESNEDEHDLRSGRFFPEFDYPGQHMEEQPINFTNWDTYLYTRDFLAVNQDRQLRQLTKLMTYPATIASFLHDFSPYDLRHRLTQEGLRSVSALRYTLHPPAVGAGQDMKDIVITPPPVRLFILGARAESSLPRECWFQLTYMFPRSTFHLIFIGPESMKGREAEYPLPDRDPSNPYGAVVERVAHNMKISTFVEYYHTLHDSGAFQPHDPYFDCFVLFHPGLGHPGSAAEWEETLPRLLETKLPILCTGYTEEDMTRDVNWVSEKCKGEYDILLEPGENKFKSLRWDINDADPTDLSQGNWGVWAFRGKRYEATTNEPLAPAPSS